MVPTSYFWDLLTSQLDFGASEKNKHRRSCNANAKDILLQLCSLEYLDRKITPDFFPVQAVHFQMALSDNHNLKEAASYFEPKHIMAIAAVTARVTLR